MIDGTRLKGLMRFRRSTKITWTKIARFLLTATEAKIASLGHVRQWGCVGSLAIYSLAY